MRYKIATHREKLLAELDSRLPDNVERDGREFMVEFSTGLAHFESLANSIPAVYDDLSKQQSVILVLGVIVSSIAAAVAVIPYLLSIVISKLATFDYSILFRRPKPQPIDFEAPLHELIQTIISLPMMIFYLTVLVTIFYLMYLALFIVLLPGVAFHEFGHLVAAVRTGVGIESYGLLFIGPLPMGAFVKPACAYQWDQIQLEDQLWILSNGVYHDLIHGSVALLAALFLPQPYQYPVGVYGLLWLGMSATNALPLPKIDGGLYCQTIISDWWDFDFEGCYS